MATVTRGGRAGRRRVLAYFQRPEQASEAVRDLRQRGARARLFDAGRLEDARTAWAELLKVNPGFSLVQREHVLPYKNAADFRRRRPG